MSEHDRSALLRLLAFGGPRLLGRMSEHFRTAGPQRADAARAAFNRGDFAACELAMHSLASSAGQLGMAQLADACREAERAAANRDARRLAELLDVVERRTAAGRAWLDRELLELVA